MSSRAARANAAKGLLGYTLRSEDPSKLLFVPLTRRQPRSLYCLHSRTRAPIQTADSNGVAPITVAPDILPATTPRWLAELGSRRRWRYAQKQLQADAGKEALRGCIKSSTVNSSALHRPAQPENSSASQRVQDDAAARPVMRCSRAHRTFDSDAGFVATTGDTPIAAA